MTVLSDVKQYLGIDPADTTFDVDVMMHIDSALAVLNDLGACGPLTCTPTLEWSAVYWDPRLSIVKNVIYLQTKLAFDPPQYSFHVAPFEKLLSEYKYRIRDIAEEAK